MRAAYVAHTACIPPDHFWYFASRSRELHKSEPTVRQRHLRVELSLRSASGGRKPCFSRRKISLCRLTNEINITGANKARVKAGQISNTISVKTVTCSGCPSETRRPALRESINVGRPDWYRKSRGSRRRKKRPGSSRLSSDGPKKRRRKRVQYRGRIRAGIKQILRSRRSRASSSCAIAIYYCGGYQKPLPNASPSFRPRID